MNLIPAGLILLCIAAQPEDAPGARPFDLLLMDENPAALARDARERGDAARGAAIFFQPALNCARCHATGDGRGDAIGPDLASLGKEATEAHLIESVLKPSKTIRKGFQAVSIATTDGKTVTGLLAEDRPDRLILRDPAQGGKTVVVSRRDVDERKDLGTSIMPAGLVNGLASRQQFLDLIRYLREIADGGPGRARALRPDPSRVPGLSLPGYESQVDHAGMIAALDVEALRRGEAIYGRVCINCHGTRDKPGSLPTSLRFSSGRFKNGSDPYSLYRTLTHGFGQMASQAWMVPSQKYDVIHFLRETILKRDNPAEYALADRAYLDRLPKGTSRGPEPSKIEPWSAMDYGPTLTATYELGDAGANFAYKGVAVRLDAGPGGISRGKHWTVFDHDTMRLAGAWRGDGFIDWNGINFNGRHEIHPKIVGSIEFANPPGPGWANPKTGTFDDPRPKGRDGLPYGPLPRSWASYRGQFRHGDRVILSYGVGKTGVLETASVETVGPATAFGRTFELGPRDKAMTLQVARGPKSPIDTLASAGPPEGTVAYLAPRRGSADTGILAGVSPTIPGASWSSTAEGDLRLKLPAGETPLRFTLKVVRVPGGVDVKTLASSVANGSPANLAELTRGGSSRWPESLKTSFNRGRDDGPFAVDELQLPANNPWLSQLRLTGFDFLDEGRQAAVCTWDGDVWLVRGLDSPSGELSWRRIASGLFQPLGLKVRDGEIFVGCRDQIVVLRDLNGDGETDFYEDFNSDHQVTEHFHEFAMDLQTDDAGDFYYAKAARHGKTAIVPQHGTLLRVSRDGRRTDILATGFRAPNGVCLNDDGTFFLTDQEGFWNPKNRINHVKPGGFYGNMWGYHDVVDPSDSAMQPPVCWITNAFDRSPSELVRVPGKSWGPLAGSLLNLSYGNGKVFVVPQETVAGTMQGGMCALPDIRLPTGVMRGRFHPKDGQLYVCGMVAWASDQGAPGGLYRIRATGKPMHLPVALHATRTGMKLTFTEPLDRASASDTSHYSAETWALKRSANYGSKHYDQKPLRVASATLSADGRTVTMAIPEIKPAQGMEIRYRLIDSAGRAFEETIHNTIHHLPETAE